MTNPTKQKRLRRSDASRYLLDQWGVSRTPNTLAKLASTGGGPSFEMESRFPLYTEENLDAWAENQLSPLVKSTSEFKVYKASNDIEAFEKAVLSSGKEGTT